MALVLGIGASTAVWWRFTIDATAAMDVVVVAESLHADIALLKGMENAAEADESVSGTELDAVTARAESRLDELGDVGSPDFTERCREYVRLANLTTRGFLSGDPNAAVTDDTQTDPLFDELSAELLSMSERARSQASDAKTGAQRALILRAACVVIGVVALIMIGRRRRARAALTEASADLGRRFSDMIEHSSDHMYLVAGDGSFSYVSPSAEHDFGRRLHHLDDLLVAVIGSDDTRPADEASPLHGQTVSVDLGDRVAWFDFRAIGATDVGDEYVLVAREVTDRVAVEQQLIRQANEDDLTGLPNRPQFVAFLTSRISTEAAVSVLFIDLDGFKAVNDGAGHSVGDEVLRVVARRLRPFFTGDDHQLARLGGDEFAGAVPTLSLDVAHIVAQQLIDALEEPIHVGERTFALSASVGLASAINNKSAEDLIRAADTAMYVAKADSSNHVAPYRPAMRDELVIRLRTEAELRHAIEDDQLRLRFQPLVDMPSSMPHGAEALVRWQHPTRGMLSPAEFVGVAESSGLIVPVGRWVLREACRTAVRWQELGCGPKKVAVNVSPRQFRDHHLVADIADALDCSGLDPSLLEVEVTESVLAHDVDTAIARLREIQDLGAILALDDFGTGYSSLSYLQELPFDVLKIDKSFIDRIATRERDLALVTTINQLGHDLGLVTVAEGIETPEQVRLLQQIGVDHGQGYFFARPLTPDAITAHFISSTRAVGEHPGATQNDPDDVYDRV